MNIANSLQAWAAFTSHLLMPLKKEMKKGFSIAGDIYYQFIKVQDVLIIQLKH